ncbi:hypothetical protein [Roseiarcus fermentans]|uniref:hypothetical protein n=1 Tax=Roseiarcus fermentans TaxID=1473586 RepID=UPI000DEA5C9E|nr:hypothetical protein [Roseiarcus fermentans]
MRIVLGLAACQALAGCVTDRTAAADLSAAADSRASAAAPDAPALALDEHTREMVAKARALAFADPGATTRPVQVDLAMLAMQSNPTATHRLDGPSSPGAASDALPPEEVMRRLRQLSGNPGAPAGSLQDDRSRDILARLQALSHRPPQAPAAEAQQPVAAPARAVSPEAIMRRMRELSGGAPDAPAQADGGKLPEKRQPPTAADADAFGGLAAVVPAPDMARTPAVERAIHNAAGAAQ